MEARLINLTPHAVTIVTAEGEITVPPYGRTIRREETRETVDTAHSGGIDIPITRVTLRGLDEWDLILPSENMVPCECGHFSYDHEDTEDCIYREDCGCLGFLPDSQCECGHHARTHEYAMVDCRECGCRRVKDRRQTLLIVSRLVAEACPERDDLVVPDDTVRDDAGRIIGCRALARVGRAL